ncbi:hypothetical protein PARHAE_02049 [Paracoccus haematequi]|uniref:Uncharacterized protein n=1 Tax=Paracoccus haematequi TaxID=2491866 RepID=A0A447IN15_9RHOB|nr:hypothetical protein [Paracoccus haematequi]VDS08864.1 hypothetical protein PARHAE_02049 [Paracoccus haematequi]
MTREYFEISAAVYAMLKIAEIAVEVYDLERAAANEKADLHSAYQIFKAVKGIDRVERDSPEWEAMMAETAGEYAASEAAKRKVYNAKRRLKAAIAAAC